MTAALLSALCWILRNGAANNLDHSTLNQELLQLGTPKEHAGAVTRVYREHSTTLISLARQTSLRLSSLEGIESKGILLSRLLSRLQTVSNYNSGKLTILANMSGISMAN